MRFIHFPFTVPNMCGFFIFLFSLYLSISPGVLVIVVIVFFSPLLIVVFSSVNYRTVALRRAQIRCSNIIISIKNIYKRKTAENRTRDRSRYMFCFFTK